MQLSRHLKRGLVIAGVAMLGVVLATVVFAQYLRSEAGSRFLLKQIREVLTQRYSIELEFSEGRLDPFSGLHLRDVRVRSERADLKLDVLIASLDFDFSFSVWRRYLTIERLHVARAKAKIRQTLAPNDEGGGAPRKSPSNSAAALTRLPMSVNVHSVLFDEIDIDLLQSGQDSSASVFAKNLFFACEGELAARQSVLGARWKVADLAQIALSSKDREGESEMGLAIKSSGQFGFRLNRDGDSWVYHIDGTEISVDAKDLRRVSKDQTGERQLNIDRLQGSLSAQLNLKTPDIDRPVMASHLDGFQSRGSAKVSEMKFVNRTSKMEVIEQDLRLDAVLPESAAETEAKIRYTALGIVNASLLNRRAQAEVVAKFKIPRDLGVIDFSSYGVLEKSRFLELSGKVIREGNNVAVDTAVRFDLTPEILKIFKSTNSFSRIGRVQVKSEMKARIENGREAGLELDLTGENAAYGIWRVRSKMSLGSERGAGETKIDQIVRAKSSLLPLVFAGQVNLTHRHEIHDQSMTAEVEVAAPGVSIDKLGTVKNSHIKVRAERSRDGTALMQAEFSQTGMEFIGSSGKDGVPLNDLRGHLKAKLEKSGAFEVEEMNLGVNGATLRLEGQASGRSLTQDIQARAKIDMNAQNGLDLAGGRLRGKMEIPLTISILNGREAAIEGMARLQDFGFRKGSVEILGMSGRVPINERLVRDAGKIRFARLIAQNPFERVDFERVRPLLDDSEPVRIEKIAWEEKTFGPFLGYFSVEQNMISAHQFDLDLGHGRLYGEMFFDVYPANMQFGLLSRLSGLNLGEFLPRKYLARVSLSPESRLSLRSGFVLNVRRGILTGRIDITEIGGPQMVAMINVLDPKYEDEKLNKVRDLLRLGYPTSVALDFGEGYMNMDLDLSLLGVAKRQVIRQIPIASLVGAATAGFAKTAEKGPLK